MEWLPGWVVVVGIFILGYLLAVSQDVVAAFLTGGVTSNAPILRPVQAIRTWLARRSKHSALRAIAVIERTMEEADTYRKHPTHLYKRIFDLSFSFLRVIFLMNVFILMYVWIVVRTLIPMSTPYFISQYRIDFPSDEMWSYILDVVTNLGYAAFIGYFVAVGRSCLREAKRLTSQQYLARCQADDQKLLASLYQKWSKSPDVTAAIEAIYTRWPLLRQLEGP